MLCLTIEGRITKPGKYRFNCGSGLYIDEYINFIIDTDGNPSYMSGYGNENKVEYFYSGMFHTLNVDYKERYENGEGNISRLAIYGKPYINFDYYGEYSKSKGKLYQIDTDTYSYIEYYEDGPFMGKPSKLTIRGEVYHFEYYSDGTIRRIG